MKKLLSVAIIGIVSALNVVPALAMESFQEENGGSHHITNPDMRYRHHRHMRRDWHHRHMRQDWGHRQDWRHRHHRQHMMENM